MIRRKEMPMNKPRMYTTRVLALFFHKRPRMFISLAAEKLISGLLPFAGIYFSAKIINELLFVYEGIKEPQQTLVPLIYTALAVTALGMLISALLRCWKNYEHAGLWYEGTGLYVEKWLDTDFQNRESARVNELYSKIRQTDNWGGQGLLKALWQFDDLCAHTIALTASVSLTVSLFTSKVQAGHLAFLNSPLSIFALGAVLLALIVISARLTVKGESYWTKGAESARQGNRVFSAVCNLMYEKKRAMDVRLYGQHLQVQKIAASDTAFLPNGIFASYARKGMGLCFAAAAFTEHALMIFIYIFVGLKALGGAFPAGQLMQYAASITAFSSALAGFFKTIGGIKNNEVFLKDTFEFLDMPDSMPKGTKTLVYEPEKEYVITFKNISFTYPGSERPALRAVNVTLNPKDRLAIVGKNGSGKTTFIKLLCRLYDPDEGEILLNGVNIAEYTYDSYAAFFSVVFQDFNLPAFTLGQNVAAAETYDTEKVRRALAKADFHLDPATFTDKEDTYLSQRFEKNGVSISGGEGQKIAIARALYKDSPFLILDEPTAALDPLAEQEIYSRFNEMTEDKTAVFISHRLSSCRFCSKILVFDEGHIVQSGRHEDLVADTTGVYYALWNAQAQHYTHKE